MPKEILEYIRTQRIGVLAVEMLDGSPHAATVHFACVEEPFLFLFETEAAYRKAEALLGRATSRATFVVGTTEAYMKTLQLDGNVELLRPEEENLRSLYLEKFPKKKASADNGKFIFFKFTPTWWRFTDWTQPKGKTILLSNE
jgi:hypothetical protein